ncbi:hypothetical protein Fmac_007269 [Flemingia macrophylla]|uniref:Uncharacterized protein n=1 Tax=Flemingia macrophylla TaxID=520843 RepID=A0ABD1NCZ7_9FABA
MVPPCITTPSIVKVLISHHFVFPVFGESFKESKTQVLAWLYASPSARATSSVASAPRALSASAAPPRWSFEGAEQLEEPNQIAYQCFVENDTHEGFVV